MVALGVVDRIRTLGTQAGRILQGLLEEMMIDGGQETGSGVRREGAGAEVEAESEEVGVIENGTVKGTEKGTADVTGTGAEIGIGTETGNVEGEIVAGTETGAEIMMRIVNQLRKSWKRPFMKVGSESRWRSLMTIQTFLPRKRSQMIMRGRWKKDRPTDKKKMVVTKVRGG